MGVTCRCADTTREARQGRRSRRFPARSAVTLLGPDPVHIPQTGLFQPAIIDALRAGTLRTVSLADLHGLVSFPSFHTVAAILFAWAAWPVRLLRGPMLVTNLAMLAATPVDGAHYFVDLAGGGGIALLALASVRNWGERPAITGPVPLTATY
jgi:membrane-associated phospholipid phosphatase